MRRQSYLIYLIFGGIVLIFAFNFGPGQGSCAPKSQGPSWVAKVDGEAIRPEAFALLYRQQVGYLQELAQKNGQELDPQLLERLGVRQHIYDQLVDTKLLAADFARLGGRIGDPLVAAFLAERYGVRGVDFDTYAGWVRNTLQMSVERFEEGARESLAAMHMMGAIGAWVPVGDAELELAFRLAHDRAQLTYVRYDMSRAAQEAAQPAQIDGLLAGDRPAVDAFYQASPAAYRAPLRLRLQRISRALPADASDADRQAVIQPLEKVNAAAAGRALSLAAVARGLDEAGGGAWPLEELGWREAQNLPSTSASALLGLEPGQTSAPLQEGDNLALYAVLEREEARRRPLAEVERQVAADLWLERAAIAGSRGRADALHSALLAGQPLAALTEAAEIEGSDPLGQASKGLATSLAAAQKPLPGAHGLPAPHEQRLAGARAASAARPPRITSPWLQRDVDSLDGLSLGLGEDASSLLRDLFAADPQAVLPKIYRLGDSFVVGVVTGRERPEMADFSAARGGLREAEAQGRRPDLLRAYLAERRAHAKVAVNPQAGGILAGVASAGG